MAIDRYDFKTRDWVDEDAERRHREEQAHARRQARKEKQIERHHSEAPAPRRPVAPARPKN